MQRHPDKNRASGAAPPLSKAQLEQARQQAVELLSAFREVVAALPGHARGASGMSRHLSVARTTCQRLVGALREADISAEALVEVPGAQGLRQVLDAIQEAHGESAVVQSARQQVAAFDRLVRDLGGSQAKLRERLMAQADQYDPEKGISESARQRLFEAAVSATGRECDVLLNIYAIRPQEGDPSQQECVAAHGMIGNVIHSAGMPVYFTTGRSHAASLTSTHITTLEEGLSSILPTFCSEPPPLLNMHHLGKDAALYILDHERYGANEVVDVVFASRTVDPMIDPATGCFTLDSIWALMNCPCRHQVLDVYLHRDMERQFRPNADLLLWSSGQDPPADLRWAARMPIQLQMQLLGEGLDRAACPVYPRHAELTSHLFEALRWRADEFIGFRCEMVYPVWRSAVCMFFTPI